MSDAIYRDEQHAIIRAMAVDSISTCKPAEWQQQHSSGYVEELTKKHDSLQPLTTMERLTQDCMTRARIHRTVSRGVFYAVVAKYGADENERADAVNSLVKIVDCEAPDDLKRLIIWSWCCIKIKRGLREQVALLADVSRTTFYRKRRAIVEQLQALEDSAIADSAVVLSGLVG